MTPDRYLLDPTSEQAPPSRKPAPRLASLEARTIALLDISKTRGDIFLDQIERRLAQTGVSVKRYRKPTFARVAPVDLQQRIAAECHGVIEALAD